MNSIRLCLLLAVLAGSPVLAQTREAASTALAATVIVVEVTADRRIVYAGDPVDAGELFLRVHAALAKTPEARILIRVSGADASYEAVGQVIYTVFRAGAKDHAVQVEHQQGGAERSAPVGTQRDASATVTGAAPADAKPVRSGT